VARPPRRVVHQAEPARPPTTRTPATTPIGPVDDSSVVVASGAPATAGNVASSDDELDAETVLAADDDAVLAAGGVAGEPDAVTAAAVVVVEAGWLDVPEPAPVDAVGVAEPRRVDVADGVGVGVATGSAMTGAHSRRG
jgi:hypothetical protein